MKNVGGSYDERTVILRWKRFESKIFIDILAGFIGQTLCILLHSIQFKTAAIRT